MNLNPLYVIAPVGQLIMHSPQFTQLLSAIFRPVSNAIADFAPLPPRPITSLSTSAHARTHRSHRMHAEWSIAMEKLLLSGGVMYRASRGANGDSFRHRVPVTSPLASLTGA